MTNKEKYVAVFVDNLDIKENQTIGLKYQSIPTWDSVGHMGLIAGLEDAFDIQLETDDIVEFDSFENGIKILKKYDINIE